jgi:hypothetical protein
LRATHSLSGSLLGLRERLVDPPELRLMF